MNKAKEVAVFLLASLAGYVIYRKQTDSGYTFALPDMGGVLADLTAAANVQFFADLNGSGIDLNTWVTPMQGRQFDPVFSEIATQYKLPAGLLSRIAAKETGNTYRTDLTSPRGASGLMQLMPANWRAPLPGGGFRTIDPVKDVRGSINMAGFMLWENFRRYKDWPQAIAAYNSGWAVIDGLKAEALKNKTTWLDEMLKASTSHANLQVRKFRAETYNYVTTIAKDTGLLYYGTHQQGVA